MLKNSIWIRKSIFIRLQIKFSSRDPVLLQLINHEFISRHVNDEESSRIKTHLLIDSYNYYYKAINENQSDSIETSTTSCSSNQGNIFLRIGHRPCISSSLPVSMNKSDKNDPKFDPNSGISSEVLHTAFNLHKQGLMMPWIFQCLYKVQIFL